MAGLVPAIPIIFARSFDHRDRRDKPGDDARVIQSNRTLL
jgi:hypothetical protein